MFDCIVVYYLGSIRFITFLNLTQGFFFSLLLEREEGRAEGRERNIDVREKHRSAASSAHPDQGSNTPRPGMEIAT